MKRFFFSILILLSVRAFAQTLPQIQQLKSPEASAIDQVIEVPVSYYTGVPQISIPLYEVSIKGASVPISLSYNAGGIRVDQEATVVGLGWSLSYGGQISRSVKGKPDEYSFFNAGRMSPQSGWGQYSIQSFLDKPNVYEDVDLIDRYNYLSYAKAVFHVHDYRPDEFYYSAQGYSGRFMYNQAQNKFVFFPREDIKVDYTYSAIQRSLNGLNFYPIESWLMTLPNGTTVKYGLDGISKSGIGTGVPATTTDMWKVKQINNTFGESITFLHTPVTYTIPNVISDEYSYNRQQVTQGAWANNNYEEGIIQTITFPNGTVNFELMDREDLPTGGKAIKEITVLNTHGQLIRRITFSYSYFSGNHGHISVSGYLPPATAIDMKRLRLDAVTITGATGGPKAYKFTYITKGLTPSKRSFSQDMWGYFNGKNNITWVPKVLIEQDGSNSANRAVDPAYSDIFTLSSITYPTGGKTVYEYEANQAQANISATVLAEMEAPALKPVGWGISVYGGNRLEYDHAPTSTGPFGEKYFRQSFTIPAGGGRTKLTGGWSCSTNFYEDNPIDNALECYNYNVDFILERVNSDGTFTTIKSHRLRQCGGTPLYQGNNYGSVPYLEPGNYRMSIVIWYIYASAHVNKNHVTNFGVYWLEQVNPLEQPAQAFLYAGGIRVKKIKYLDRDGSVHREKQYSYTMPASTLTSGQIVSFPCFVQNWDCQGDQAPDGHCYGVGDTERSHGWCSDVHVFGNPVYGIQTTAGASLGYEYVTEKIVGDEQTGDNATQYWFSMVDPIYNSYYRAVQEGIREPREWLRGRLRSVVMTKNGVITKSEVNEYYETAPHVSGVEEEDYVDEINTDLISDQMTSREQPLKPGFYDVFYTGELVDGRPLTARYWFYNVSDANLPEDFQGATSLGGLDITTIPIPYHQSLPYFKRYTGFDKLQRKTTDTYDEAGNRVREIQEFEYGATPAHHQLTQQRTTNSRGVEIVNQTKYPTDYPATAPYTTMVTNNMLAVPIEQIKTVSGAAQSVKTNYATFGTKILPSVVQALDGTGVYENRFEYLAYNPVGNATLLRQSNDVSVAYVYGYRNQYIIAEAQNVATADLAYANFEDDVVNMNPGNWELTGSAYLADNTSPLGTTCYVLGGSVYLQKTGLTSARQYTVSYRSKNGSYTVTGSTSVTTGSTVNGWTYYAHTVTGVTSLTIQGTGRIDEIKLYPKDAMIKTYTYKELAGITSVTDANNVTSYYEYDGQGRLRYVRDDKQNILQSFDYQYANGN